MFGEGADFFTLKGVIENVCSRLCVDKLRYVRAKISYLHEGRTAEIFVGDTSIGYLGEVYPDTSAAYGIDGRAYVAEINLDVLFTFATEFRPYKATPKYPAITRDLALLVKDGVSADMAIAVIKKVTNRSLLESVKVFDVYKGMGVPKGNTSLALTLTFRAADRTLKEDEVNAEIEHALRSMNRKYRIKLRK
jgi:Phenylalanyl-tRNA synthetase beta subunit